MGRLICILVLCCAFNLEAQFSFDALMRSKPILQSVAANRVPYRVQIIYTQIDRDEKGVPHFTTYEYHVDSSNYFYCASLVKLPTMIVALEKLKELHIDKSAIMFTDSANACQHSVRSDTSAVNHYPSMEQYIKKMSLVSDNLAFGRAYEFVGVDYLHTRLARLGFPNIRIIHRFDGGCKGTDNTTTNPVSFYDNNMKLLYHQPQQAASKVYRHPLGTVKVGKAYYNAQNKKVNEPRDFTGMNYIPLKDIHELLRRLVFDQYIDKDQRYCMEQADRIFLLDYLTRYPRESDHPSYNKSYYDSYKKYLVYGDSRKPIGDSLFITNIVGQSYGFMADCAYICNKNRKVEFMLSAVIYANADGIINDGKYEYNTLALPFLAELGREVYRYELGRKK